MKRFESLNSILWFRLEEWQCADCSGFVPVSGGLVEERGNTCSLDAEASVLITAAVSLLCPSLSTSHSWSFLCFQFISNPDTFTHLQLPAVCGLFFQKSHNSRQSLLSKAHSSSICGCRGFVMNNYLCSPFFCFSKCLESGIRNREWLVFPKGWRSRV